MVYSSKSRFKADKQRKASVIQKWGKARCTMNAAWVPCWDCFWSSLGIDWNTKDLIRGGKCNMLRLTSEPIPTIQLLSPVESHLRVKFFLGTGFYVELFASFLVLSAVVNSWARCSVVALWKPRNIPSRGLRYSAGTVSFHLCCYWTGEHYVALASWESLGMSALPTNKCTSEAPPVWVTLHSLGPVGISPRVTLRCRVGWVAGSVLQNYLPNECSAKHNGSVTWGCAFS